MESKVYTVNDLMSILNLSRSKTYDFVREAYQHQTMFRVIKIMGSYRIPKESFDNWLSSGAKSPDSDV